MSTSSKKRRAIGYVRVSVDGVNKISPDVQRAQIESYCDRKGWPLVDVVIERGKSAGKGKRRPGFDRVRDTISAGRADALVVFKLDRASRSVVDFADLWGELDDIGAEFVSVTEGFDTSTAMGRAMLQIATVFAELERGMVSERMKSLYRHRRELQLAPNGTPAYGYRKVDDRLVPEPIEAAWLNQAIDWLLDGLSLREVARRLNSSDAPTPGRAHGGWRWDTLRRTMLAPTIAGKRTIPETGEIVDGGWDPIIDPAKWERVSTVLADPKRRTSTKREPSLLSGIARCGQCGAVLRTHKPRELYRYRCVKSDSYPHACSGVSIDAAELERHVVGELFAAVDGRTLHPVEPAETGDDVVDMLRDQIDETNRQLTAGEIAFADWQTAIPVLRSQLDAAEQATRRSTRDHSMLTLLSSGALSDTWESFDVETRRGMIRQVFGGVIVNRAEHRGQVDGRVALDHVR
jgi:DNA invertase Pin-like site-specific DNA recombinase